MYVQHAWVVGSYIVYWASRSAPGRAGGPHLGLQYGALLYIGMERGE
jgi:hypothetical protein